MEHIPGLCDVRPIFRDANRTVAKACGLDPDGFEHIPITLLVFARKRPEFSVYLPQRLAEWKAQESLGSSPREQ